VRKHLKTVFFLVPVGLVGAVAWYLGQDPFDRVKGVSMEVDKVEIGPAGQAVTGITLQQSAEGRTVWSLSAPRAERQSKTGITTVFEPDLTVHREDGESLRMRAMQGEVAGETRESPMVFSDQVRVEDTLGRRLTTEWMKFEPAEGLLSTDRDFQVDGPRFQLFGRGLRIFKDEQRAVVLGRVKLILKDQG